MIRTCSQTYWNFRNYTIDSKNDENVKNADFSQSMFGPDKKEWPGSPVGFSWDIEFLFHNGSVEYITLDALYESEWTVSAERSKPGKYGPETVEVIFEYSTKNEDECISFINKGVKEVIKYCNERKRKNA